VALKNFDLLRYLIKEVTKSKKAKFEMLREFVPSAKESDWTYYEAGQRAQIIKPEGRLGSLQFGTEVISSADGSIAGLLGASPGASVSVDVMMNVFERFYGEAPKELLEAVPAQRSGLNQQPSKAKAALRRSAKILKLKA
jgi:malate dehydrogenase (quinone)